MADFKAGRLLAPEGYLPAEYRVYESGVWRYIGDENWKQVTKCPVTLVAIVACDYGDDWRLFLRLDKGEQDSPLIDLSYAFLLDRESAVRTALEDAGLPIQPWEMAEFRSYLIKSVQLTGKIQEAEFTFVSGEDIRCAERAQKARSFNDRVAAAIRHFIYGNSLDIVDYSAYSRWQPGKLDKPAPAILHDGRYLFSEAGLVQATEGVPLSLAVEALQANDLLVTHKGTKTCRLTLTNLGLPLAKYYAVHAQRLMAYQTAHQAYTAWSA